MTNLVKLCHFGSEQGSSEGNNFWPPTFCFWEKSLGGGKLCWKKAVTTTWGNWAQQEPTIHVLFWVAKLQVRRFKNAINFCRQSFLGRREKQPRKFGSSTNNRLHRYLVKHLWHPSAQNLGQNTVESHVNRNAPRYGWCHYCDHLRLELILWIRFGVAPFSVVFGTKNTKN